MSTLNNESRLYEILEYFYHEYKNKNNYGSFEIPLKPAKTPDFIYQDENGIPVGKIQIDIPFSQKNNTGHILDMHLITWDRSGMPVTSLDCINAFNAIDRVSRGSKFLNTIGFEIDEKWPEQISMKTINEDEDAEVVPGL